MRQRREPRSFPLTRRAELRAGPDAASLPPPPPLPDAQSEGLLGRRLPTELASERASAGSQRRGRSRPGRGSRRCPWRASGSQVSTVGSGPGDGTLRRGCPARDALLPGPCRLPPATLSGCQGGDSPAPDGAPRPESGSGNREATVSGCPLPSPPRRRDPKRSRRPERGAGGCPVVARWRRAGHGRASAGEFPFDPVA